MKKISLVSSDKWINKIKEDKNLKYELKRIGMDASIISWQSDNIEEDTDLLVLRSVWGYQNYYKDFKEWLIDLKNRNIPIINNVDIVLDNINKEKQFNILSKNDIKTIDTCFVKNEEFDKKLFTEIVDKNIFGKKLVFKPTISGSGENTFLYDGSNGDEIFSNLRSFLDKNKDSNVMVQPYVSNISHGEYSCIFIDRKLTHTMLRFPGIFSKKINPYEVENVADDVLALAHKVEKIDEFKNYSYMRVDIVEDDDCAKIMEVELADPDLLTKYLDSKKQAEVIKKFAKTIKGKTLNFR